MTDRERAEAVVAGNLDVLDEVTAREVARDIEAAFAAMRAEERERHAGLLAVVRQVFDLYEAAVNVGFLNPAAPAHATAYAAARLRADDILDQARTALAQAAPMA